MSERFIGLMSGTSIDGVDGVVAQIDQGKTRVLSHVHLAFDEALRAELLALNASGTDELHRAALAANALARSYAEVVHALLSRSPGPIRAIGAHGQTVRHRPGQFDGTGYTVQLNAPALLAELTGTDVVADFRSRDVAAGGQGAPLVPAFHRAQFGQPERDAVVVNIGGIANLTLLHASGATSGHDCGPGNVLMDGWASRHIGVSYDDRGAWASSGSVDPALLSRLLAHPFLSEPPPKSTGRDDFHMSWLDALMASTAETARPQDVQSTLCELTAVTIARDVLRALPQVGDVIACGGGALNDELMRRLQALLPSARMSRSDVFGLPPMEVEAAAFAWMAHACVHRLAGNVPGATGAAGPRVLGALYPA